MNNPNSNSINSAYRDLLIEMRDWRVQKKVENLSFYADALVKNELHVIANKEFTVRKCNCDICLQSQKPGVRKFRFIPHSGLAFWVNVCDQCWDELITTPDMPALVLAQVNTGALA